MSWFDNADDAIVECSQAIAIDSQNTRAYLYRGEAHRHNRNFDDAITDFTRVIGMTPSAGHDSKTLKILVDAHLCRGATFGNKGNLDAAIDDFSQAIKLNPNRALAWYDRGVSWHQKGKFDQAIADYSRAIELDPNDPDAYMRRGLSWKRLDEHQCARTDFAMVRKLKSEGIELRTISRRRT